MNSFKAIRSRRYFNSHCFFFYLLFSHTLTPFFHIISHHTNIISWRITQVPFFQMQFLFGDILPPNFAIILGTFHDVVAPHPNGKPHEFPSIFAPSHWGLYPPRKSVQGNGPTKNEIFYFYCMKNYSFKYQTWSILNWI